MNPWQIRVVQEHAELLFKIEKLREFLKSDAFLELSKLDRDLLDTQGLAMTTYANILTMRINNFEHEVEKDD